MCPPVMLRFKKFKTEHYERAQKAFSVPPGMLGGDKEFRGEKKNTPSGEGEGREGE